MKRLCLGLSAVLILAMAAPASAEGLADGTWRFSYFSFGNEFTLGAESTYALFKVETKEGKVSGDLIASPPRFNFTLDKFSVEGDQVRITLKSGTTDLLFEGKTSKKDNKRILGTYQVGQRTMPAQLAVTDLQKLDPPPGQYDNAIEPMKEARAITLRIFQLRRSAAETKDEAEKKKLQADIEEAQKEMAKAFSKVVEQHADNPAVFDAAGYLLRTSAKSKATPEQVQKWAGTMAKAAEAYGSRWQKEIDLNIAETLLAQNGAAAVALDYALKAEKQLDPKASDAEQVRVLKVSVLARRNAGKADEGKDAEARLAKIEDALDKDYETKVPPFKPDTFAGRKGKSDRVVVMELFTGAQCPPCVAADVAFDALHKTYKPSELILIQYHMHIPGPDPLTNADCEARWDYYRAAFPGEVRGTPTAVFNGKAMGLGGGGPMANAEPKYTQYRGIIDPLLEARAGAKVTAAAVLKDNQLQIQAEVTELAEPGENMKLRFILVEESIRYVGGNGLRFHHQVVRAMPGGVEGFALKEKSSKHTASADLKEVRKKLEAYLDDYAANKRAFPYLDRPLDLKHLRVIALVQNDATQEIVQAVEVEVASGTAAK